MKNNLIIIIAGEPRSVFLEVFLKALKYKKYKSPIILICNKKILKHHMKKIISKKNKCFRIYKTRKVQTY